MRFRDKQGEKTSTLVVTLLVYAGFCLLTYLGNFDDLWLGIAAMGMFLLPPLWAWRTGGWLPMGFSIGNVRQALLWGGIGGVASACIGILVIGKINLPKDLIIQLAIGIPMWLFLASPFQEFFFRGWMQSRLELAYGKRTGILLTVTAFTLWHFTLPIFGPQSTFPINTFPGLLGIILSGIIYSYVFSRTRNIIAPVIAHTFAGIIFIVIGASSFLPV